MTLRTKLLLAQAPLALALVITSYVSVRTSQGLGLSSQNILKDNFRSVLASQRIKDAAEGLDGVAVGRLLGGMAPLPQEAARLHDQLEGELRVQEGNITERGEQQATERLRRAWTAYQVAASPSGPGAEAARRYAREERPALLALRQAADEVLTLNLDAMVAKNERVQRTVADYDTLLILATLGACLAGLLASVTLTSRLLRPLGVLSQAVRRIALGDLGVRVSLEGRDEIAELAKEFNTMTDRLATYRRSSLGELLEAQQSSQAAIDSLPDPVVVFDAKANLVNVNLATEKWTGISVETGLEVLSEASPAREAILRVRAHVLSGKGSYAPKGFEEAFRLMTPEGERYFLPRASPVYAVEGELGGATVVLQDVTRLRLFDELTHDLVATVAHEFRTPLTSLRMAVHLCLEQVAGPISEKQADLLQAAREDCERLQAMVEDLLNVARIQSGTMRLMRTPLNVEAFLTAVVGPYEKEALSRGLEFRVEPAPEGLLMDADPARLELVFKNLLGNAVRHTQQGHIALRVLPGEGFLRFEVSDTGPGIPAEFRERVFDKFFQVPGGPRSGAGLGLHIAREVVRAHGGEMGLEKPEAEGSTFWFTVPLRATAPREP